MAALNDLDVLSADIQNAYLTAPINEKYYVQTGMEFPESLKGRPAKVVRALYGLPVAGHSFRSFLAKNLKELGYESTKGDADFYMRPAVKKNGEKYYGYLIAYVDDIICCGEDPRFMMECIEKRFTLKNGTIKRSNRSKSCGFFQELKDLSHYHRRISGGRETHEQSIRL